MKHRFFYLISLGLLLSAIAPLNGNPLLFSWIDAGATVAQSVLQRPQVQLQLSAARRQVERDRQGQEQVTWSPLAEQSTVVQPGDVLRYSLNSSNRGNRTAAKLVINQPIPQGMVYVPGSVKVPGSGAIAVTYSIDRGKTFVEQPTVQVTLPNGKTEARPAPPEAYTHLRFNFAQPLPPATTIKTSYEVRVR